jgi:hypothetical protein
MAETTKEERMTVAAIYTHSSYDHYFHASMSCSKWVRGRTKYLVSGVHAVINAGKYPCTECWVSEGYLAEHDIMAAS